MATFLRTSLFQFRHPPFQIRLFRYWSSNSTICVTMPCNLSPSFWNTSRLVFSTRYKNILGLTSRFSYAYMIDNVVLLITGTLHERDTHELLERCHPLGVFDTMPALCVATNVEELYQSVLVETPLGAQQLSLL